MDLSKRTNLRNVREVRLAGPSGSPDSQWRVDPTAVEFRDDSTDFYVYRGEASVVGHSYEVNDAYGTFEETIRAGAFDKTLRENPDVSFVYMHDMATVMASTRGGGLSLSSNPHLSVEARLPKNDVDVQRFAPKAMRGDASAMSFAFRVMGQNWSEDYTEREITEVNLHRGDVSGLPTGLGANPAAWGSLRSDKLDRAFRAMQDGSMTTDQVAMLAELLASAIDLADDAADALFAALGIPDPDAAEDAAEAGDMGMQMNSVDPDEARAFMERLIRVRERARLNDAA